MAQVATPVMVTAALPLPLMVRPLQVVVATPASLNVSVSSVWPG